MKAIIVGIFLLLCFCFCPVYAQNGVNVANTGTARAASPENPWYYGGSIGFNLWNDYTYVGIFPLVGYKVTPQFSVGGKAGYAYISDDRYQPLPSVDTSNYGGSVFSRYRIVPQFYVHGEFAYWSYEYIESYNLASRSYRTKRDGVPFLWLGGGLSQQVGRNTSVFIEVLFDVIQDRKSPYDDWEPVISVGVGMGF